MALGALAFGTPEANATGRDFVDEVLVASGLGGREFGLELGADSRIDRDYRLQGWFTTELEAGITRAWIVEGVGSFVNRGRGLEFGTLAGESRYVLAEQPRWPLAAAISAEYEIETRAAKHFSRERIAGARAVATRTFANSILATANLGLKWRLAPIPGRSLTYAFGVRYPEGRPITYGFEWRRDLLEHEIRLGPEVRIALGRMTLRLGSSVGLHQFPYRYVGRAILETEL